MAADTESRSWSRQYQQRLQVARAFGPIEQLPVIRRARDLLLATAPARGSVLEVGAGDRRMRAHLERAGLDIHYESQDVDPDTGHDYRQLDEVRGPYDLVFAFEVIEHLPVEAIPPWLDRLASLLRPGGTLLLSTPNTYCPQAYLRDATHRTPLCYDELGALVSLAGLRVRKIVRLYNESFARRFIKRRLFGWQFRLLGLDFAPQIALAAEKSTD